MVFKGRNILVEGQILQCRNKSSDAQDNNTSVPASLGKDHTLVYQQKHTSYIYFSYITIEVDDTP